MSETLGILVLHGITMSGASMLRTLGPLGRRLEELGFTLVAPTAPHRLEASELDPLLSWMSERYRNAGQNMSDSFRDGKFWDAGERYDWSCHTRRSALCQPSLRTAAQRLQARLRRAHPDHLPDWTVPTPARHRRPRSYLSRNRRLPRVALND